MKPKLKLSNTDGNVFSILARASKAGRNAGWSAEQINTFSEDATSGDYDHALQTCMTYFEVS